MKKMTMTAAALLLSAVLAFAMTGCGDTQTAEIASTSVSESTESDAADSSAQSADSSVTASPVSFTGSTSGKIDTTSLFSERDLTQTADLSDAKTLTVSDGQTLTITEAGVYVISGTASDCTIVVDAADNDKVQLVLDGAEITNSDFPAIYVKSADKVFITTAAGSSNVLRVTGQFRADGDTNTDAVIFSKDDLVLNGTGSLTVESVYGNGISGKDDLKITGGTYDIQAKEDAVEANDSIAVCGGTLTVQAGKDGFHCENDDAAGYIYIADGTITVAASSDGIQATDVLQIDGGTVSVTGSEGLEATYVQINGGKITVSASDDGINASQKCSTYSPTVEINGGELDITVGQGDTDAIDANGSIIVNGGYINVTAPTSSFDYDTNAEFNGGTIIINGEEVDEIPEDMMGRGSFGGGMRGGFGGFGGQMPSDFDGQMPSDFDGQMPSDFDGQMPSDFDGQMPSDSGGQMPGGFGGRRHGSSDSSTNSSDTGSLPKLSGGEAM